MRPFQHARSSADISGRHWRGDLEIHEFIDSTKSAFPDLRHRMILHSVDLGGELATRAFPDRSDVRQIVRQHVMEDLGEPRTLRDWLAHCRREGLPKPHPRALPFNPAALIEAQQKRHKLADPQGPESVLDILRLPEELAPEFGVDAWCVLCNAFGPAIIRRVLGPPHEVPGADGTLTIFDPAWCAEMMIFELFQGLPELRSVVTTLRSSHQAGQPMITPEQRSRVPQAVLRLLDWQATMLDKAAHARLAAELDFVVKNLKALDVDPIVIAASPNRFDDVYWYDWRAIRVGAFYSENYVEAGNPSYRPALDEGPVGTVAVKEALDHLEALGWRDLFAEAFRLAHWDDQVLALVIQDGLPWLVFSASNNTDDNHVFALWDEQPIAYFGECVEGFDWEMQETQPLRFQPAGGSPAAT